MHACACAPRYNIAINNIMRYMYTAPENLQYSELISVSSWRRGKPCSSPGCWGRTLAAAVAAAALLLVRCDAQRRPRAMMTLCRCQRHRCRHWSYAATTRCLDDGTWQVCRQTFLQSMRAGYHVTRCHHSSALRIHVHTRNYTPTCRCTCMHMYAHRYVNPPRKH